MLGGWHIRRLSIASLIDTVEKHKNSAAQGMLPVLAQNLCYYISHFHRLKAWYKPEGGRKFSMSYVDPSFAEPRV